MKNKIKKGFTLIELIVVMAVIGVLVLLAAPKLIGYTERARETKHIHTAKVIETALEAYLINGGAFPDDLEVVDATLLEESINKESLIGAGGYIKALDEEVYYELTYDFIKKLDVKLSASNQMFVEALASSAPNAVYSSNKGVVIIDKSKTQKDFNKSVFVYKKYTATQNILRYSLLEKSRINVAFDGMYPADIATISTSYTFNSANGLISPSGSLYQKLAYSTSYGDGTYSLFLSKYYTMFKKGATSMTEYIRQTPNQPKTGFIRVDYKVEPVYGDFVQGEYMGEITTEHEDLYPLNGYLDGFWYVKMN